MKKHCYNSQHQCGIPKDGTTIFTIGRSTLISYRRIKFREWRKFNNYTKNKKEGSKYYVRSYNTLYQSVKYYFEITASVCSGFNLFHQLPIGITNNYRCKYQIC